jgi:hypothetical protein
MSLTPLAEPVLQASAFPHILTSAICHLASKHPLEAVELTRVSRTWQHDIGAAVFAHMRLTVKGTSRKGWQILTTYELATVSPPGYPSLSLETQTYTDWDGVLRGLATPPPAPPAFAAIAQHVRVLELSGALPVPVLKTFARIKVFVPSIVRLHPSHPSLPTPRDRPLDRLTPTPTVPPRLRRKRTAHMHTGDPESVAMVRSMTLSMKPHHLFCTLDEAPGAGGSASMAAIIGFTCTPLTIICSQTRQEEEEDAIRNLWNAHSQRLQAHWLVFMRDDEYRRQFGLPSAVVTSEND